MKKNIKLTSLNEAKRQFRRFSNHSTDFDYCGEMLNEAQDDMNMPPQGGDPNEMGGGMPGDDPNEMQGGDPNAMQGGGMPEGDPNAMGGGDPNAMQGGGMPGGDPNAMQGSGMDPNEMPDPMGGGMPGEDPNAMGGDGSQELDIDDLTNAQQTLNKKMNRIGKDYGNTDRQIAAILNGIEKLSKKIDNDNNEIANLKKEIEKRNPTPVEKLNLRSIKDSYPFNIKPETYWQNKMANSNYQLTDNDNPGEDYTIYDSDIDDNLSNVSNTFNVDDDDEYTLKNILGM